MTITLPHPPNALRPNGRGHWSARAKQARVYRALAKWEARTALGGRRPPRWKRARVRVTWCSATSRHPDPDNIVAMLKCAFDGLQDAGVVADDRGLWPERPVILKRQASPEVRLVVEEEPEDAQ